MLTYTQRSLLTLPTTAAAAAATAATSANTAAAASAAHPTPHTASLHERSEGGPSKQSAAQIPAANSRLDHCF